MGRCLSEMWHLDTAGHCICDWHFFVEVGKRRQCLGNLSELEGAHKVIGEGIWSLQGAGED